MEPRRLVTSAQVAALLSYVEKHGDLVLGKDRSASSRAACRRQWDDCAAFINREGEPRSGKDWAKYWSELKCRVKAKLGTSSSSVLTPLEERVAVFVRQGGSADSTIHEKDNTYQKDDEEDESDDDVPLVISLTPRASPRPPPLAEPSPQPITPPSSGSKGSRGRSRLVQTRATQYSPSIHVNSNLAQSEERHARMEARRARFEERRARLEERRAKTEQLLAEAVMQRTEAAVVQAEAARTQAHALTNISHALQQFVDAASLFLAQPNRF
ncbi:hypothetical protein O0L34_g15216 [Tuta absoluta]|nr:hypothetical protein O0L34_g15216 [Tuta absoluta]